MRKLLFFILPVLLFISCSENYSGTVTNNSSIDLEVYYTNSPETIYTLSSGDSLTIDRDTTGTFEAVIQPASVGRSVDWLDVTYYDLPLLTYTVTNTLIYDIIINGQTIKSGETVTITTYHEITKAAYYDNDGNLQYVDAALLVIK